jgi:PAS domain S-box-containing protein/putative nucleotidyltransferase with HDIG domain
VGTSDRARRPPTGTHDAPAAPPVLAEIIDVAGVQALMDDFHVLTGLVVAMLDTEGQVLVVAGWQDVCMKFHRVHPETLANCRESDTLFTRGVPRGEFRAYTCKNGLTDVVTPLFVGDVHVGNIFSGQFFYDTDKTGTEFFEAQAARCGFDRDEYLAAVARVPHFPHETINTFMRFYVRLAEQIARSGYTNLVLSQTVTELEDAEQDLLQEKEYAEALIDATSAMIVGLDATGAVVEFNQAATRITGYSAEDLAGRDWFEVLCPRATYPQVWDEIVGSETDGSPGTFEGPILTKWGEERIISWQNSRLPLHSGPADTVSFGIEVTERRRAEQDLRRTNERRELLLKNMIQTMGKVVEARDPYTQGHETGVARLSVLIAAEMGLSPEEIDAIEVGALVHDIGKLSIPAEILTKPGTLSTAEFELIKVHPESGYEILKGIDFGRPVAEIALQHHERMDGSGYPAGLVGDAIIVPARIVAVADVLEAMASHRPYRPALGVDAAMSEIGDHPEKYDQDVVAACRRLQAAGSIVV